MKEENLDVLKYSVSCKSFMEDILGLTVKDFHNEWIELFENNIYSGLMAPRSHGKTSIAGGYITWKIVTNPEIRILIVTINQNKAEDMMSYIKDNLAYNEKLKSIFGDLTTGYWSKSAIRVKNPKGPGFIHKEPTLQVLGVNSSQISSHYDIIVLDDVCDNKNSRTALKRKRQRLWYNNTLLPMLEPIPEERPDLGGIINIGTTWKADDFHHYLMELSDYNFAIYSALDEETGEALWPERFSREDLIKLRDEHIGKVAFEMQYQNKIVQTSDSPIQEEWINKSISKWIKREERGSIPKDLEKYMGVDLASKGQENDDFSITIIGKDNDNNYYVLENINTDKTMSKQLEMIKSLDEKYNVRKIGIESNATQKIITDEWIEQTELPIIQLKSSWVNDKDSRAERLGILFETNRIIMDPEFVTLKDQLIEYPRGKHDDALDSLSFAIQTSHDGETHEVDWNKVVGAIRTKKRKPYINKT